MTEYETLYLLVPDLPTEKVEEFNRKIEELIKSHQGQVLAVFNFGKRKLAYRVGKTFQGIYVHFNYLGQGNLVAEVERVLKYDDTVLKFITVKLAEDVKAEERAKEKKEFVLCTYDEANDRAA